LRASSTREASTCSNLRLLYAITWRVPAITLMPSRKHSEVSIRKVRAVLVAASVGVMSVLVLVVGCGPDSRDLGAFDDLEHWLEQTRIAIDDAIETTEATTVEGFIEENSLAPEWPRAADSGLPWIDARGLGESELEEYFLNQEPVTPREPAVVSAVDADSSQGIVQVFLRAGSTNQQGFEANPHRYYYACFDLRLDVKAGAVYVLGRSDCPEIPEMLVGLAEPVPEDRIPIEE
jgi:hypothetical protein